jgi:hypothetical protein
MEVVMKLRKLLGLAGVITIALSFGVSGYAAQQKAAEPAAAADDSWKFHSIVDVDFVKQQVKIPMPEDVMIIDARPKRSKYDKGHIPMAVSIPDSNFDKMVDMLPKNKSALLVYYCEGLK